MESDRPLCACGCGQEVRLAPLTQYGVKGKPYKFILGHNRRPHVEAPYGYCHCGCGEKTNIADQTFPWKKGMPLTYCNGHNRINEAKAWAKELKIERLQASLQTDEEEQ